MVIKANPIPIKNEYNFFVLRIMMVNTSCPIKSLKNIPKNPPSCAPLVPSLSIFIKTYPVVSVHIKYNKYLKM